MIELLARDMLGVIRVFDARHDDQSRPALSLRRLEDALRQVALPSWPDAAFHKTPTRRRLGCATWEDGRALLQVDDLVVFQLREYRRTLPSPVAVRRAVEDQRQRDAGPTGTGKAWTAEDNARWTAFYREDMTRKMIPRVVEMPVVIDTRDGRVTLVNIPDLHEPEAKKFVERLLHDACARPVRLLCRTLSGLLEVSRGGVPLPNGLGSRFLGMLADRRGGQWLDVDNGPCLRVDPVDDVTALVQRTEDGVTKRGVVRARGAAAVAAVQGTVFDDDSQDVNIGRLHLKIRTPDQRVWSMTITDDGLIRRASVPAPPKATRTDPVAALRARILDLDALVRMSDALMHAYDIGPLTEYLAVEPQRPLYAAPAAAGPSVRWSATCPADRAPGQTVLL